MSQARQMPTTMTAEGYLAWSEGQELKWEYDGFQPVAMVGGTFGHARIQANIVTALGTRLRGRPCRPCGSDMRVPTLPGRYRYPDALVSCTPLPLDAKDMPDPVVVFEVLSPSTAQDDRTVKLAEYQSIPTLRRYVMLEQDRVFATVISRTASGWDLTLAGPGSVLAMPEIGIEVPMAELYDDLDLPAPP